MDVVSASHARALSHNFIHAVDNHLNYLLETYCIPTATGL
jgi:hypothetical protein